MPTGNPIPSSATSSRASLPSQRQEIVTWVARAWRSTLVTASWAMRHSSRSWRIGSRPVSCARRWPDQAAAILHPLEERFEGAGQALGLGDVGAQVVERVAHLADDAPDVVAQAVEGGGGVAAGGAALHDAVELEGEVGQGLADAVVEVAGDPGALLVGADGSQPPEPAGVVDGQRGGVDEAGQQLDVPAGEVVRFAVLDGDEADDRPAGREDGIEPGGGARGEARAPAREEVLLADQAAQPQRPAEGLGEVVLVDGGRWAGALPPERVPAAVRVVEHQDRDRVEGRRAP